MNKFFACGHRLSLYSSYKEQSKAAQNELKFI